MGSVSVCVVVVVVVVDTVDLFNPFVHLKLLCIIAGFEIVCRSERYTLMWKCLPPLQTLATESGSYPPKRHRSNELKRAKLPLVPNFDARYS